MFVPMLPNGEATITHLDRGDRNRGRQPQEASGRAGRDGEEDPIRISIYSRKDSVKQREREECRRGKENLLFSFSIFRKRDTHT